MKKASAPIDVYYEWIDFIDKEREKEFNEKLKDEANDEEQENFENDNNADDNDDNDDEDYNAKVGNKYDDDDEDY